MPDFIRPFIEPYVLVGFLFGVIFLRIYSIWQIVRDLRRKVARLEAHAAKRRAEETVNAS